MALSANPTRTRVIERAWHREVNRRWAEFTDNVVKRLVQANEASTLTVNAPSDPFVLSPTQQRVYMAYLEQEIQRLLLETEQAPNWQGSYQLQSYERGLQQVRASLMRQGAGIVPTALERATAEGLKPFSATPALSTTSIPGGSIHADALEFLYERSYTSLKGWTDALARETRQILFAGVEAGDGVGEIAKKLTERIAVSRSRALVIARTETNQAYSRASIAEVKRASAETGEGIELRWITARDSRVRQEHAEVHGIVMDTTRASYIKTTDGVNCRCALAPVVPGTDTVKRRDRFTRERSTLLLQERA